MTSLNHAKEAGHLENQVDYLVELFEKLNYVNNPWDFIGLALEIMVLSIVEMINPGVFLFTVVCQAQLKIPVSGCESQGHLYVSSSRDAPFLRY